MNGYFVISLDFEKHWGVRDHFSVQDYRTNLANVDEACIRIHTLFKRFGIQATWATVGLLSFENKKELLQRIPKETPRYVDSSLTPYESLINEYLDPKYHFAPDFIKTIISDPDQEFASHTYSHYYCNEPGQNRESFEEDLKMFNKIVSEKFGEKNLPKSIIFPRNQVNKNYLPLLKDYGIKSFRGNERNWLHRKKINITLKRALRLIDSYLNITGPNTYSPEDLIIENKILDIPSSRFLRPFSRFSSPFDFLKLNRIKNQMSYAAKNNELFHLWWHPHNFGNDIDSNLKFLEQVLQHFDFLNKTYNYQSTNMINYYEKSRKR